MKKNILVVNDDGINAEGIHKLAEALSEVGYVYVCSPHVQQSASGHGFSIGRTILIEEVPFPEATRAFSIEGTPADCVKIGLEIYRERGIEMDMVFSGFNHGSNLGTDTLYSGTVSAAIEGAFYGLPAAAMSICSDRTYHIAPNNFEAGMEMAKRIACSEPFQKKKDETRPQGINFIHERHVILSVNVPDAPKEMIKGIKVCPLSYRAYDDIYDKKEEDGQISYYYTGHLAVKGEEDADESDIVANGLGYTTITPLHFDLTNRRTIKKLQGEWNE